MTRPPARTLPARLRAWWRSRYETGRPLPVVGVEVGRWLPGGVLRAAFVVAVAVLLLASGARTTLVSELVVVITGVPVVWAAVRPGPGPAHVALVTVALLLLGSTSAPFDPAVLWLAPLGYVVTRLGWWASHVGVTERVELAALRHSLARDGAVVAGALAIGGAAWTLAGRPVPWLVALGVVALAALAWTAVRRDDGEAG
ncbi:hypothetical protein [Krasilnikoviella flava]|uniref:Uncharacterized protein n=1 Tax=Krasilnikoviella flava TaxID=526729 RepID=A0A1T5L4V0_9MICO|nr:hypothetical protein [Krasilnikoviella flava]SKC71077.1 hypothetical protein SAMN04324258_2875 [Krasilnikoviella flava]